MSCVAPRRAGGLLVVWLVVAITAAATAGGAAAVKVTISNTQPRRNVLGEEMDAHDGNIVQWEAGGLYYYYGMGYGNCTETTGIIPPFNCPGIYQKFGRGCGFQENQTINIFTSPDLAAWTYIGEALPVANRPVGIYFRPKVIYNANSKEYVLWANRLPPASTPLAAYPHAGYVVATSPTPDGPFAVVTVTANTTVSGGGDFTVFVDPAPSADGAAYLAYDAWGNGHRVSIERLTPDYHNVLQPSVGTGPLSPSGNEAPVLFERAGWYYLLYGNTCCFCSSGAGSHVMVARHPLGPWSEAGYDLNPGNWLGEHRIRAQENFVVQVQVLAESPVPHATTPPPAPGQPKTQTLFMYTGDMWDSAPDHLKSHDLQYWQPLAFNDTASPPVIAPLAFVDSFTLDMPASQVAK